MLSIKQAIPFFGPIQGCRSAGMGVAHLRGATDGGSVGYVFDDIDAARVREMTSHTWQDERMGTELDRQWEFEVDASLSCKYGSTGASDVIGAIDFDMTGIFFATGGIARKVRVYSLLSLLEKGREERMRREESAESEEEADGLDEDTLRSRRRRRGSRSFGSYVGGPVLDNEQFAISNIYTHAKLSGVKWVPGSTTHIGCSDYDGVVAEWDLEKDFCVHERHGHSGKRVWSIDYSRGGEGTCASGSEDGTVRLWQAGMEQSCGVLRVPSERSACSVEFSPGSDRILAIACADTSVYMYDLRVPETPFLTLHGHSRTATYVRHMGPDLLASASIDSSIRLWDISSTRGNTDGSPRPTWHRKATLMQPSQPPATYDSANGYQKGTVRVNGGLGGGVLVKVGGDRGSRQGLASGWGRKGRGDGSRQREVALLQEHTNLRQFVGLAVKGDSQGGFVATGSESNDVVVYQYVGSRKGGKKVAARKVLSLPFADSGVTMSNELANQRGLFVSAVSWRQAAEGFTLAAANSEGIVRIITGSMS